ncbi:MAG: DUF2561 family protein [Mycobacterium sp.]|nr:DUF2561 family protein [Mycobacterium sp.]
MTVANEVSGTTPLGRFEPAALDRILWIACAVVWLLAIGAGVAATVALVHLGSGHQPTVEPDGSKTPWLLYAVIAVSALVIAGAVPLLLRARRTELSNSPHGPVARAATPLAAQRAASRSARASARQAAGLAPVPVLPPELLDRLWLRCGFGVFTAVGGALLAVAIATYLMAVESDGASWALYGLAGVITLGMTVIPVLALRQLRAALSAASS